MSRSRSIAAAMSECDEGMRRLRQERVAVQLRITKLRGMPRLLPDEFDQLNAALAEDRQIVAKIVVLRERKMEFAQNEDVPYERAFMFAAKEMLDDDLYAQIHVRAKDMLERRRERRESLGVGSAIPMLGTAPPMRERR